MQICWGFFLPDFHDKYASQTIRHEKYKDVENRAGIWLNDSRLGLSLQMQRDVRRSGLHVDLVVTINI